MEEEEEWRVEGERGVRFCSGQSLISHPWHQQIIKMHVANAKAQEINLLQTGNVHIFLLVVVEVQPRWQ